MSKANDSADKGKKPEGAHPQGAEAKPTAPSKKDKGHAQVAGSCFAHGCKANSKRLDFCEEHFDHFKFGLIKKNGEPVSDYEKKFEHYRAYVAKRNARKVA